MTKPPSTSATATATSPLKQPPPPAPHRHMHPPHQQRSPPPPRPKPLAAAPHAAAPPSTQSGAHSEPATRKGRRLGTATAASSAKSTATAATAKEKGGGTSSKGGGTSSSRSTTTATFTSSSTTSSKTGDDRRPRAIVLSWDTFLSLPTFAFCFASQPLFPPALETLHQPATYEYMHSVVSSTMGITLLIHLLVGLGGYLRFGADVSANVLDSLPSDSVLVGLARLGVVLAFAFTFPMMIVRCAPSLLLPPHPSPPPSTPPILAPSRTLPGDGMPSCRPSA